MRAAFTTQPNGSVAVEMDGEAVQAMFASVIFASKYHEAIRPLAEIVQHDLRDQELSPMEKQSCR